MPSGDVPPVDSLEVSKGLPRDALKEHGARIECGEEEWGSKCDAAAQVPIYTDPLLKKKNGVMADLGALLVRRGLARVSEGRRGRIGVFTVTKKNKKLRLIFDCRRVNFSCQTPPSVSLGSVEAMAELEVPPDSELFCGQLDIKDCFYECGIPPSFGELFGLDAAFVGADLLARGITKIDGLPLVSEKTYYICLCVLPMGFSWSFWLVQCMHEQLATAALRRMPKGDGEQPIFGGLVQNGRPAPAVKRGEVQAMVYCDNLNVLGDCRGKVDDALATVRRTLTGAGF